MEVMHAVCSQLFAAQIERQPMSSVRARVANRQAVVTASTWHPITVTSHESKPATHFLRAEFFPEDTANLALEDTAQASKELQEKLDQLQWLSGEPSGSA